MRYNRIDRAPTLIHSYFVLVKLHSYLQNMLRYIRFDIAFSLLRDKKKTARNLTKTSSSSFFKWLL